MPIEFMRDARRRRSLQETLKNTLQLLKHSFTIVGKNTGIAKPTVRLAMLSVVMNTLFFLALGCFFSGNSMAIALGVICLLVLVIILVPLRFFIRTFLKATQSWMTYKTITGSPVLYQHARRHTRQRTSGLMFIGFVDMVVAYMTRQNTKREGIVGVLTDLLLSAFREVWDLLNHYMIPAVVVEGKPLKQCLPDIKAIRSNVPATLVGVFGIDFAGEVLRGMLLLPYLLVLALGVGLGYLLGFVLPEVSWTIGGITISWVPPLLAIYLNCLAGGILKACVESLKAIYFTIFYTTIMHGDRIPEKYREQLTGYLHMGAAEAGSSPAQPAAG